MVNCVASAKVVGLADNVSMVRKMLCNKDKVASEEADEKNGEASLEPSRGAEADKP